MKWGDCVATHGPAGIHPGLQSKATSRSMVLPQVRIVLTYVAPVTTEGSTETQDLD